MDEEGKIIECVNSVAAERSVQPLAIEDAPRRLAIMDAPPIEQPSRHLAIHDASGSPVTRFAIFSQVLRRYQQVSPMPSEAAVVERNTPQVTQWCISINIK